MKIFFLHMLFFISSILNAQGWEWQNPLPSGFPYNDVVLFSRDEFLISCLAPVLLRSTNGGKSWEAERTQGDSIIFTKMFNRQKTVFARGEIGSLTFIWKSVDRGRSFSKILGFALDTTMALDFQILRNQELIILSMKNNSIILSRSSDDGITWEDNFCPQNSSLFPLEGNGNMIAFSDYYHGIISGPESGPSSV